jgi:hypothetical protein
VPKHPKKQAAENLAYEVLPATGPEARTGWEEMLQTPTSPEDVKERKTKEHAYFAPQEITGYVAAEPDFPQYDITPYDTGEMIQRHLDEWGPDYKKFAEQIADEELTNIPIARDIARMKGEGEILDEEAIERGRMMQGGRGQLSSRQQQFIEQALADPREAASRQLWESVYKKKGIPYKVWKEQAIPRWQQGLPMPMKGGKYVNPQDYQPLPFRKKYPYQQKNLRDQIKEWEEEEKE